MMESSLLYYVLSSIFFTAFIAEMVITGRVFLHRSRLRLNFVMRWWAIVSLGAISSANMLGYLRLYANHTNGAIDHGNVVQAFFALSGLSLMLWVAAFHSQRGLWR